MADAQQLFMKSVYSTVSHSNGGLGLLELPPIAVARLGGRAIAGPLVNSFTCYSGGDSALPMSCFIECFDPTSDGSVVQSSVS